MAAVTSRVLNALISFEKQCREIPVLVLRLLSLMLVSAVSVLFLKIVSSSVASFVLFVVETDGQKELFTRKMSRLN